MMLAMMKNWMCGLMVCLLTLASHGAAFGQGLAESLLKESPDSLIADVGQLGDPVRGALVFYRAELNCHKCHEANQRGRALGPDLSQQRLTNITEMVESILSPSAKIRMGFESQVFLLEDGRQLTGVVISEDAEVVVLDRIEEADEPLRLNVNEIVDRKRASVSMMPIGLANQLSDRQEFLDLIRYLVEIAARGPTRAAQLRPATSSIALAPLPAYESSVDHRGLIASWDATMLEQGAQVFKLRCASCHGDLLAEGTMPTSLRFPTGKFKHGADPFSMYQTLTHGYGMMIPQRWMVPEEKYAVIHYIRETFLKDPNPSQYFPVDESYLAALPKGDTRGPKPVSSQPWTAMNYGPSLINTIEVPGDQQNIAQKGIAIRLDSGPGGVESGRYWMMYDHDTMRMAAAWSGTFIDYEGIHFNGAHGRHPTATGVVHFQNPDGPGWGRPVDGSFVDDRVRGRDDRQYGPLPRSWAQYRGLFRHGDQTIVQYTIDQTTVLESPGIRFAAGVPTYVRTLNLGPRKRDLILQVTHSSQPFSYRDGMLVTDAPSSGSNVDSKNAFDGAHYFQSDSAAEFNTHSADFSIVARIKTNQDGTIWSKTVDQQQWVRDGQSLFIRDGRLVFDVGWVGAVQSKKLVADNQWHDIALTWQATTQTASLIVDGKVSGRGKLAPQQELPNSVIRIGATNENFPATSFFVGEMASIALLSRALTEDELADSNEDVNRGRFASWSGFEKSNRVDEQAGPDAKSLKCVSIIGESDRPDQQLITVVGDTISFDAKNWLTDDAGNVRLRVPAGDEPLRLCIQMASLGAADDLPEINKNHLAEANLNDLLPLTKGGSRNWPEVLETEIQSGPETGAYVVDVLTHPVENPYHCRLRLTGLDFIPGEDAAVVSTWDGSVWRVSGIGQASGKLKWTRIAAGLFQPLGIKWKKEGIFVTCRDQLVSLHDLNEDGEMDWYECFNNDHQVTEHFHEFAMGLQTDAAGNFYYAKSARHALTAVVPHHGTLLKVSADGQRTEIIADGFRAANGVCINPDGSFVVTDQEGHWNPKNRINWVRPGGFYGNMFGYHDVTDDSDDAMVPPLCWITNAFDRSPAELLWVDSNRWGPLGGALLNFSYGNGKVFVVPHEEVGGKMQGGMCALDLPAFPTGIMRGRFNPQDGQLYCCGMFAWSSTQEQPGGLYRVRYVGGPANLPIGLQASQGQIKLTFSDPLDADSAATSTNYAIRIWGLKRTANYGSEHYDERELEIETATLLDDRKTVILEVPSLVPTWCMEIVYVLKDAQGRRIENKIHNTIHQLGEHAATAKTQSLDKTK